MIPILWQDEHLLVVDKPAGMLVVEAPGRSGRTLVTTVGAQLGAKVHAVHRLDEDTTGVLVLAKTLPAKQALEQIFREHAIERLYLALVSRAPTPPAGRIESRLTEGPDGVVRSTRQGGEWAVTHYKTLARAGRHTLVECRLETGRRNQIRAHLSELGSPIVGDRKYGWRGAGGERVGRLRLHAHSLRFTHPLTGEEVVVSAKTPEWVPA